MREKTPTHPAPITNHFSLVTTASLKIVNGRLRADAFENFFHKLKVLRMHLVGLLGRLAGEDNIQRDLVRLIHHGARAGRHLADVELKHAGDGLEILVCTGDEFVGSIGLRGVGPEDDNVGEHNFVAENFRRNHDKGKQGIQRRRKSRLPHG